MPDRPDNQPPTPPTAVGDPTGAARDANDSRLTRQHLDTDALSAFIDDRLDGDLGLAAAGHIAACPDCRSELAELRATVGLLGGLPQYRPRRSFSLGPEYARPVRTSRLARLLPLLPVLRSAAVAVFLLLAGVGAADILTEIGEDAADPSRPAAMADQTGGDTAMQPDAGAIDAERVPAGDAAPAGDGTGGDGFASQSESESASRSVGASQGDAAPGDESSGGSSAPGTAGEAAAGAPISAAPGDSLAATAGERQSREDAEESASDADSAAAAADGAPAGPADAGSLAGAPPAPASASNGAPSAAAGSAPVPTVAIATDAVEQAADTALAEADTSGAREGAGSANDSGVSNWRLIELVLAVALIALVALVVALNRLGVRARRIGVIR